MKKEPESMEKLKIALSMLESAVNLLRDSVTPKDGEHDTVGDLISDYDFFFNAESKSNHADEIRKLNGAEPHSV